MSSGYYVFDKEGNGLDVGGGALSTDQSKVWCIVFHDLQTEEVFHADVIGGFDRAKYEISNAKMLVGHNILGHDLPIMKRLWDVEPPADCLIVDTLVWSRALYPDRTFEGGHGLEAWGKRNDMPKPPIEDWTQYTPETLHRCYEDVRNNVMTYQKLLQEAHMYNSAHFLWLEQEVAKVIFKQCKRGHAFNKPLAEWLLEQLDTWIKKIDRDLAPWIKEKPKLCNTVVKGIRTKKGEYVAAIKEWYDEELKDNLQYGPVQPHKKFEVLGDGRWVWGGEGDPDPAIKKNYEGVFCRVDWPDVNLNSDQQLMAQLERYGWVPVEFTDKGNPKLTDESLEIIITQQGLDPVLKQLIKR